jgi:hypothetical protein
MTPAADIVLSPSGCIFANDSTAAARNPASAVAESGDLAPWRIWRARSAALPYATEMRQALDRVRSGAVVEAVESAIGGLE